MPTLDQEVIDAAERDYRSLTAISGTLRPAWETLDQAQKETLALIWFAGYLAGRTQSKSDA